MRTDTMDQYTLQSYFKSLCNSFYIAYQQMKRLEKKQEKLEDTCPYEESEMIEAILKISGPEELQQKYMAKKYSREKLEKQKEKFELAKKEYDKKYEELEGLKKFWTDLLWGDIRRIAVVLRTIKENNFSIIVSSKEEIIALMAYFRGNSVSDHDVINTEEEYLKSFPTGEKIYEEFFSAYCLRDEEKMKEVCRKYF